MKRKQEGDTLLLGKVEWVEVLEKQPEQRKPLSDWEFRGTGGLQILRKRVAGFLAGLFCVPTLPCRPGTVGGVQPNCLCVSHRL